MARKLTMQRDTSMTFAEGVEEFMYYCKARNLRQGTINHYRDSMRTIFKFVDRETKVKDISRDTIDRFVVDCKENLNINDVTLHTYVRDLKTIINYFIRCEYLKPFKIPLTKANKKAIETYSDTELRILLKKPDIKRCSFVEYRNWVIINFLLSTGVRLNSMVNVRIKDLDFDNVVVYVNVTKNRKALIIPMNKTIARILKEYLKVRQYTSEEDYLFCNVYGKQLVKKTISYSLNKYNRDRGVMKTGIHRYRHTFAKKWIVAGGNVVTLQKILGHSSLQITENYINVLTSDLKRDIDRFNILDEFNDTQIKMKRR